MPARLNKAEGDAANWLSYGRTYSEQRFSPLAKITGGQRQAARARLVAALDTNRASSDTSCHRRGMYVSTAWSMVKAYDAASAVCCGPNDPKCRASAA